MLLFGDSYFVATARLFIYNNNDDVENRNDT